MGDCQSSQATLVNLWHPQICDRTTSRKTSQSLILKPFWYFLLFGKYLRTFNDTTFPYNTRNFREQSILKLEDGSIPVASSAPYFSSFGNLVQMSENHYWDKNWIVVPGQYLQDVGFLSNKQCEMESQVVQIETRPVKIQFCSMKCSSYFDFICQQQFENASLCDNMLKVVSWRPERHGFTISIKKMHCCLKRNNIIFMAHSMYSACLLVLQTYAQFVTSEYNRIVLCCDLWTSKKAVNPNQVRTICIFSRQLSALLYFGMRYAFLQSHLSILKTLQKNAVGRLWEFRDHLGLTMDWENVMTCDLITLSDSFFDSETKAAHIFDTEPKAAQ